MKSTLSLLPFLAVLAAGPASGDDASTAPDTGSYRIYRGDQQLGSERFSFDTSGDSAIVTSFVHLTLRRTDGGTDTLTKTMAMVVKAEDYDLRSYESHQSFLGQKLHRGLVMNDTSFSSYLQINKRGEGRHLVRPPGRIFVIDPQVFALYDVICRNLHGRSFASRPLRFYVLGSPDTSLEVTATDLGAESIRWGSSTLAARKIRIDDGGPEYFLWISPRGRMLRLSQPAFALRVERQSPAAPKRRARSRTPPGG